MSSSATAAGSGGMGLAGWLTILFVALKLTGQIDWSWWWVLSPLWISFIAGLFIVGFVLLVMAWADSSPRGAVRRYQRRTNGRR